VRQREVDCSLARLDVGAAASAVATRGELRAQAARLVEIMNAAMGQALRIEALFRDGAHCNVLNKPRHAGGVVVALRD
jgi:hypothetical protein